MSPINPGTYTYRTAEAVSRGHPDKLADKISDAVMMLYLKENPNALTGLEALICGNVVHIAGEVKGASVPDKVIVDTVQTLLNRKVKVQLDIRAQGAELNDVQSIGANDQCTVVGYACRDTKELLPFELVWARKILKHVLGDAYETLDAKCQVMARFEADHSPELQLVVVSSPQENGDNLAKHRAKVTRKVLEIIGEIKRPYIEVNPGGTFIVSGSDADTGVTGRKIIADTYGPSVGHGGGAFSGKDPSKLDRSGAYMARHLAKQLVRSEGHQEVTVHLSYSPGHAQPTMVTVNTHTGDRVGDATRAARLTNLNSAGYDLSTQGIIDFLVLRLIDYNKEVYVDPEV